MRYPSRGRCQVAGAAGTLSPAPIDSLAAVLDALDGLQLLDSDLDIACVASDLDAVAHLIDTTFGACPGFTSHAVDAAPPAHVASFVCGGLQIEIFGQGRPVVEQHAFRHMIVEARLMAVGGPDLRDAVLAGKRRGLSTEEAFAGALGLPGDPYDALLELEALSGPELAQLTAGET